MAVLSPDTVAWVACDDCPNTRVIVTEAEPAPTFNDRHRTHLRVTILQGCETCEGGTCVVTS